MTYKKIHSFSYSYILRSFLSNRICVVSFVVSYLILMSVLSLSLFVKGQTVFHSRNFANDICVMLY